MVTNINVQGKTQEQSKDDIKYMISFLMGADHIKNIEITDKDNHTYVAVEAKLMDESIEINTNDGIKLISYDNIFKIKDIEKNIIIFEEIE